MVTQNAEQIVTGGPRPWREGLVRIAGLFMASTVVVALAFWIGGLMSWGAAYKVIVAVLGLSLPLQWFDLPIGERRGRVATVALILVSAVWLPLAAIPVAEAVGFDVPGRLHEMSGALLLGVGVVVTYVWFLHRQLARTRRRGLSSPLRPSSRHEANHRLQAVSDYVDED